MNDGEPGFTSRRLEDVEAVHRAHPRSFSIPRRDQRYNLRPGQLVKLIFLLDAPVGNAPGAERMWVEVRDVVNGRYTGTLESQPIYIANIGLGDPVEFGPEHVAGIYHESPEHEFPFGKTLLVSKAIVSGDAWPHRLIRQTPTDVNSSGWLIYGAPLEADTREHVVVSSVEDILRQYMVLDSVLDETVGTAWRWNEQLAEYQREGD